MGSTKKDGNFGAIRKPGDAISTAPSAPPSAHPPELRTETGFGRYGASSQDQYHHRYVSSSGPKSTKKYQKAQEKRPKVLKSALNVSKSAQNVLKRAKNVSKSTKNDRIEGGV